jgi:hypothetical protein
MVESQPAKSTVPESSDKGTRQEVGHVQKYETVVSSGQSALRALLTMNGGAVVVFLTCLDHLWIKDGSRAVIPPGSFSVFVLALSWYIGGIFAALLSYGSIFVTNCFSSIKWEKSSDAAFVVTLIAGLSSLAAFLIGSWEAVGAFRSVLPVVK